MARDEPLVAEPNEHAAPVAGELIEVDAIVPSADQQASDRSGRIGKTAVQVGTPAAIVAIATWAARLAGVDLDPGAGVDMPAEIAGAWVGVLAVLLAYRMNPKPPPD